MDKGSALPANFSVARARKFQAFLSSRIVEEDRLPERVNSVAGVDVAYLGKLAIGAVSVIDFQTLKAIEERTAVCEVRMPYVPTLLAFREIPAMIACVRKLTMQPDVFLIDGHGTAHPFGFGSASHFGLIIGKPTIGVAKTRLFGKQIGLGKNALLTHGGKVVGAVVKTVEHARPIYVSVGHLVSLRRAIDVVGNCALGYRVPEPLRQAHRAASEKKRQMSVTE